MGVNWLKTIFLVLLSSFIGIMSNPEVLTASDSISFSDLDKTSIVETIEEPEEVIETPKVTETPKVIEAPKAAVVAKAPSAGKVESKPATSNTQKTEEKPATTVVPANNVKFSWGVQEVFRVATTATNAGNKAALVGTLLYGHNYTSFGNITKLKLGETFTMTIDGVTKTYKVSANPIDGKAGVVLDKTSSTTLSYAGDAKYSSITMNALVNLGFGGHSLVLMTCYGSNSRYVVVADAI